MKIGPTEQATKGIADEQARNCEESTLGYAELKIFVQVSKRVRITGGGAVSKTHPQAVQP